jgi:UDP-N-acetyl-D-galactosamine dehydrogenase
MFKNNYKDFKPCVIGLGYVGLPLFLNLARKYKSLGYDNNKKRILELKKGKDIYSEVKKKDLLNQKFNFTSEIEKIKQCNVFIITVPTPVFKNKNPDLTHIKDISFKLSKLIKPKDVIIFESTVYPGLTEKFCVPILEKSSLLKNGKDFFVGYSPERVNPGDKKHNLKNINKILAYPHEYKSKDIKKIYSLVSKKIIFSRNIEEAETAKVFENIQRDVNIALINEFYLICKKLKLNFKNILNLASSKWNFIKFYPGLVGGHCLPVDPYYLSYKAIKSNYKPKILLAGRHVNDSMVKYVENEFSKFSQKKKLISKKILATGLSYKPEVADLRNSLSLKIFKNLKKNFNISGFDPTFSDAVAKKHKIYNKFSQIKNFNIFLKLTNHKKIDYYLSNKKNSIVFDPFSL